MQPFNHNPQRSTRAFSVTEMMVAISLLGLIVVTLYTVFNQTQKALRASVNQVDVLESGRAAMEVITRDLATLTAFMPPNGTNLEAELMPDPIPATIQEDTDGSPLRTNVLQDIFFVSRFNKDWVGTGYRVVGASNGIGTLNRYITNIHDSMLLSNNIATRYYQAPPELLHRIADGVIHLRLRAFDVDGRIYDLNYTNHTATNAQTSGSQRFVWPEGANHSQIPPNVVIKDQTRSTARSERIKDIGFLFLSNALPAYVEIELGVLDPDALKQYEAMKDGPATAAEQFLRKQAGKVHIFRKRIPIRIASQ